jgi:L-ribulose-5-phosphate 4-epimerase
MASLQKLKESVYEANMELNRRRLVLYTFGNVSGFDPGRKVLAIKPSGVPYDSLKPSNIVVVDLNCRVVEGKFRPSSDTPTHAFLYRKFKGIFGIAHTHSTFATAWAQAKKPIPCLGTTHADFLPCGVPCTRPLAKRRISGNYEEATGKQIADAFKKLSPMEVPMVLVASHGPFTWGDSPAKAVYHSVILEELAQMAFITKRLDPKIKTLFRELIEKHFFRKHGKNAYYGQFRKA